MTLIVRHDVMTQHIDMKQNDIDSIKCKNIF